MAESNSEFDQVVVPIRAIVSNLDVSNFAEEQQDDTNMQMATQLMKKMKALGRTIGQKLITGNYATTYTLSATPTGLSIPATGAVGPNQDSRRHGPGSLLIDTVTAATTLDIAYRAPGDSRYGTAQTITADGTYTLQSFNSSKWVKVTVDISAVVSGTAGEVALRVTPISATEPEWDGLAALCPTSQTISSTGTDGDELSFEVLDRLIDEMVKVRSAGSSS